MKIKVGMIQQSVLDSNRIANSKKRTTFAILSQLMLFQGHQPLEVYRAPILSLLYALASPCLHKRDSCFGWIINYFSTAKSQRGGKRTEHRTHDWRFAFLLRTRPSHPNREEARARAAQGRDGGVPNSTYVCPLESRSYSLSLERVCTTPLCRRLNC